MENNKNINEIQKVENSIPNVNLGEKIKEKKPKMKIKKTHMWQVISGVLLLLLIISIFTGGFSSIKMPTGAVIGDATVSDEQVKLDFYVMSQCPYGTQVEDAIKPVLDKFGNLIDFNLEFISTDLGNGQFNSLHGEPETQGNIVQLCAAKYNPDKYMDMVVCQNANARAIPGNWESCANQNGLDVSAIKTCFEGDEGKGLLSASAKKAGEVGARGSPTIFINDQSYNGGRTEMDFIRAICNSFEAKPKQCNEIPEPKKVEMIVVNDKRCKDCETVSLISQLKSMFPGMDVVEVDYSSTAGKEIYSKNNLKFLPALLFGESVKQGEGYSNIARYLQKKGDYYELMVGSSFDPSAEICDNGVDDDNNGQTDCSDIGCKQSLLCRKEKENHLEVFIMSDCPYGRKAIEALNGVIDNFGDKITYDVHYIASEEGDGFSSLHGQYEVDENIIQLCVKEHSTEQWFDYMYCRATKGVRGKDWKDCARDTKVNIELVQACFSKDEGKDLLREDIKVANSMGIGASPTWIANGKYQFSGIDSETVKQNLCRYNDLENCGNELSSDTGGVAAGSC